MTVPVPQLAEPNLADRVVTFFSPERGLKRRAARTALSAFGGGYTGARYDRQALADWVVGGGSADQDTIGDLPTLRARSRDLTRNNPLASGAINTVVTSAVGTGLRPQPRIDREVLGIERYEDSEAWERKAERIWRAWTSGTASDVTRRQSFAAQQALALRSVLESGDVFVLRRYVPRRGNLLGTCLQMIEADRVSNPLLKPDEGRLAGGVEMDEEGAPIRYHVLNRHPGDLLAYAEEEWSTIPAFSASGDWQTLHLYDRRRPGQTRGVPYLAPVVESLKQLGRYTDAELMAAVVSSFFTVFTKTEAADEAGGFASLPGVVTPGPEAVPSAASKEVKLGSGLIVDLAPGEDVVIADPKRPNVAFEAFMLAVSRQIGVALELPHEVLLKHFTASYSASRAALLEAWRFFYGRRFWLAQGFCQPVYEWVISEAVARGYLEAPGFFRSILTRRAWLNTEWVGDAPGQIDELKEVKAADLRVSMGISTLQRETIAINGGNWEEGHEQRAREHRMRVGAGLENPTEGEMLEAAEEPVDAIDEEM